MTTRRCRTREIQPPISRGVDEEKLTLLVSGKRHGRLIQGDPIHDAKIQHQLVKFYGTNFIARSGEIAI